MTIEMVIIDIVKMSSGKIKWLTSLHLESVGKDTVPVMLVRDDGSTTLYKIEESLIEQFLIVREINDDNYIIRRS